MMAAVMVVAGEYKGGIRQYIHAYACTCKCTHTPTQTRIHVLAQTHAHARQSSRMHVWTRMRISRTQTQTQTHGAPSTGLPAVGGASIVWHQHGGRLCPAPPVHHAVHRRPSPGSEAAPRARLACLGARAREQEVLWLCHFRRRRRLQICCVVSTV